MVKRKGYIHIHFLNPQKCHKTSGYKTSQKHNRQHNNSTNTSTNNTNYNKNTCKIKKESMKIVMYYIHLLYKKSH